MFSITLELKRPLVGLAVAAGLLVAATPANAAWYAKYDVVDGAVVTRDAGSGLPTGAKATEELFGNYNF
jgi:hypothetical protein